VPRAGHVRLLGVIGLAIRERPARLGRQQIDLVRGFREQPFEVRRAPDIRGLDTRATGFETVELLLLRGVPVVGEDYLVAGVERELRQLRADVAGPQDQ
jgi:hypothetical protein